MECVKLNDPFRILNKASRNSWFHEKAQKVLNFLETRIGLKIMSESYVCYTCVIGSDVSKFTICKG